jgi:hypothetical protein
VDSHGLGRKSVLLGQEFKRLSLGCEEVGRQFHLRHHYGNKLERSQRLQETHRPERQGLSTVSAIGAVRSRLASQEPVHHPDSAFRHKIRNPLQLFNYTVSNLGYAKTEVWGPFYESFGGDLPPNLETLHLNWLWSCDSSYNNCKTKEQFTLAKVYGNVRWNNYQLQNGKYVLLQSSTRNTVQPGTATAVHPCWK